MRVLITGSSGQLGSEISQQLRTEHETIGLDLVPGPWTAHVASILDRRLIVDLIHSVDAVIHTASLHAPHVPQRSKQEFVDTKITGTLRLLETAAQARIRRFVYINTTSVYGYALVPAHQAVWVTEDLWPRPRDIYDITKLTAEQLCQHFAQTEGMPVICLRTARFFGEDPVLMAIHRLYRGADVRDIAGAHVLAVTNQDIHFGVYNISARSPFVQNDLAELLGDARSAILRYFPDAARVFQRREWQLPHAIDRVYVTAHAERELGYCPRFNFGECLQDLQRDHQ